MCNRTPNTHLIKERLVLKDGHFEVEESRQVWELLARPSLEHAVEIWGRYQKRSSSLLK